jgi:hypothetical protein
MGTAVERLTRRVRRLERLASELQDLAVDLVAELTVIRRALAADASGRLNAAVEYAALRTADERRREALRAGDVGAWKLETRAGRAGAMFVRIDEGKWFRLARGDARLLGILASAPQNDDGFPGWMTFDEIGSAIADKTGARPTRRALVQSVHRIRKALKGADLNEYLVRVEPQRGHLRLLLRTRLSGSVTNDGG